MLSNISYLARYQRELLQNFPNIGERIVQEHKVGADAWRRTGVLTFDGNIKLKDKVTYEKMRQYFKILIITNSHIVLLSSYVCVPGRTKRRSAKRYMGIAKVTSRRAKKGFNLRLNTDKHWSAEFYKGLNQLQYVDGRDMINMIMRTLLRKNLNLAIPA